MVFDADISLAASAHNRSHSAQTMKHFQSEPAHHEDPYIAGKLSSQERVNVTRAWLEETSRAFNEAPNDFGSLVPFIGAHVDVETSIASNAAPKHVGVTPSSGSTHNDTEALITLGNSDGADDADIEVEVPSPPRSTQVLAS